jgi:hypothetical protein
MLHGLFSEVCLYCLFFGAQCFNREGGCFPPPWPQRQWRCGSDIEDEAHVFILANRTLGLVPFLQKLIHVDRAGSHAELLHHPKLIPVVPAVDQLPVRELNNGDGGDVDFAAGRGES